MKKSVESALFHQTQALCWVQYYLIDNKERMELREFETMEPAQPARSDVVATVEPFEELRRGNSPASVHCRSGKMLWSGPCSLESQRKVSRNGKVPADGMIISLCPRKVHTSVRVFLLPPDLCPLAPCPWLLASVFHETPFTPRRFLSDYAAEDFSGIPLVKGGLVHYGEIFVHSA